MAIGEDQYSNYYNSPAGQIIARAQRRGPCACPVCEAERKRKWEKEMKEKSNQPLKPTSRKAA